MTTRYVSGTVPQGVDEHIAYSIDFSLQEAISGAAVSVHDCTLVESRSGAARSDLLAGSASLTGSVAKSKIVYGLTARRNYVLSVAVEFTDGNIISAALPIFGEQ